MMQMASVGCVLSWLAGSQMKNLISIQIILGFLHSYFMNSFFFCSNVVYQSWMDKKRVFGNATVFCGIPLGAMILSPLWAFLNESFSWRGTCLIQAGLSGRILQLLWVINYESQVMRNILCHVLNVNQSTRKQVLTLSKMDVKLNKG